MNIIEKCKGKKNIKEKTKEKAKKISSQFFLEMWKKFEISNYLTI